MANKEATRTPETAQNTALMDTKKDISKSVLARIDTLQKEKKLHLPDHYSASNAINSAWLILQGTKDKDNRPVLSVCSAKSIANSLFDMVIQGLSPAKKQCYFIAYGQELTLMRSYHGTAAVLKRLDGVTDVYAQPIYAGDIFEYHLEGGTYVIDKHEQKLENIGGEIIGAYCVIEHHGKKFVEIMNKKQIDMAWSKSKNGGKVQKEFPEEMSRRTVINRAAKRFVNTSDDSDLIIESFNNSDSDKDYVREAEAREVEANANGEELTLPEPVYGEGEVVEASEEDETTSDTDEEPNF